METSALPFWSAGFRGHVYGTHQQTKRCSRARAPGMSSSSSTLTWVYSQALMQWNQQQEQPSSMKAERGSRNSWFPTWILTSVPTATLREPFFAFVSLPLFGRERKFKNYCEKHRLCMTQRLEMQNNWFWQKTGLILIDPAAADRKLMQAGEGKVKLWWLINRSYIATVIPKRCS